MASLNDDVSKDDDLSSSGAPQEDNLAQVWKELQKGEKTAQVLESNLTSLEKKIDSLLASFEESERRMLEDASGKKQDGKATEDDSDVAGVAGVKGGEVKEAKS